MIAVGDISVLKPNSDAIPIDKNDDGDIAVYLDKSFQFYIDIENKGRLTYSVKPLTLKTEKEIISSLNSVLKTQLYKLYLSESEEAKHETLAKLFSYNIFSDNGIDSLLIKFSTCSNPSLILPSLSGMMKAFTKDDLSNIDYRNLYDKLVEIGYYYYDDAKPKNCLSKICHRFRNILKLKNSSFDMLQQVMNRVIDAYTHALLKNQEIYLKFKVVSNMIKYEREFKKKLLNLFLKDTTTTTTTTRQGLDNSTLFSEQSADLMKNGHFIPVF